MPSFGTISNGETGLSVRTKLNNVINYVNTGITETQGLSDVLSNGNTTGSNNIYLSDNGGGYSYTLQVSGNPTNSNIGFEDIGGSFAPKMWTINGNYTNYFRSDDSENIIRSSNVGGGNNKYTQITNNNGFINLTAENNNTSDVSIIDVSPGTITENISSGSTYINKTHTKSQYTLFGDTPNRITYVDYKPNNNSGIFKVFSNDTPNDINSEFSLNRTSFGINLENTGTSISSNYSQGIGSILFGSTDTTNGDASSFNSTTQLVNIEVNNSLTSDASNVSISSSYVSNYSSNVGGDSGSLNVSPAIVAMTSYSTGNDVTSTIQLDPDKLSSGEGTYIITETGSSLSKSKINVTLDNVFLSSTDGVTAGEIQILPSGIKLKNLPVYDDNNHASGLTTNTLYRTSGNGASPLNVAGIVMIKI